VPAPRKKKDLADVDGRLLAETEKAYKFDNGTRVVWLPKSQCEWDEQDKRMTMPQWLAMEKELI
jgi:hypothetical protein